MAMEHWFDNTLGKRSLQALRSMLTASTLI
jgi:hypothetical protein